MDAVTSHLLRAGFRLRPGQRSIKTRDVRRLNELAAWPRAAQPQSGSRSRTTSIGLRRNSGSARGDVPRGGRRSEIAIATASDGRLSEDSSEADPQRVKLLRVKAVLTEMIDDERPLHDDRPVSILPCRAGRSMRDTTMTISPMRRSDFGMGDAAT